jgi:DNA-binding NarL/FixJ family response regulator/signal transduction histidine kinase
MLLKSKGIRFLSCYTAKTRLCTSYMPGKTLKSVEELKIKERHDTGVLDALYHVALDLVNRHELGEILDRLLVQSSELLEAPSVSIDLLEGDDLIVTYAATPGQPLEVGDRMRRGEGGHLSWQAIDTRQPVVLDDYSKWAKRRELYNNFRIHAILIIPIIHRERVIGAINFLRFIENLTFSAADIYVASQLALAAALVLDNARVYAQLKSEIDQHKRTESALREAQALMLEKEQAMAAFRERERLGRDLHDGVGQLLAYVGMQSDVARDALLRNDNEAVSQTLQKLSEAAQRANRDVRDYIFRLKEGSHSVAPEGFFFALQQYCEHLKEDYSFEVDLSLPVPPPAVLASAEVETQLSYIVFEAIQNARKHSGAPGASLTIEVDHETVQAVIQDHGMGLEGGHEDTEDRKGMHFGMGIMRSRAEDVGGSLDIETSPAGTRIIVRLPRKLSGESLADSRILLADDHPLFIDGVRGMLTQYGAHVIGVAKDGVEAQEMTRTLKPDILIMDINMPRMNGLEAARAIKAEMPEVKIVMLTTSMEEENLFAALQAGAVGYLLKGMGPAEFLTLLSEIASGEATFSSDMAAKMLEIFARPDLRTSPTQPRDQLETLSERQRDVLSLVAQGLTYKEVGQKLFLTERTVKFHMGEILKRLQIKGRRELIELARQKKL